MRRAAKVDRNQSEIVAALRKAGATVEPLHQVGGGCPDLLVGWRGINHLIEIKDGAARKSARALNDTQVDWHGAWKGAVAKAENINDALQIIGAIKPEVSK